MLSMELEPVIPDQLQTKVLFELLKAREHTISHKTMPSYDEHIIFVLNNPYRHWYIIYYEGTIFGNLYVQYDNSVGISFRQPIDRDSLKSLIDTLREKVKPLEAVASIRYKDFFFNVSCSDNNLRKCLEDIGYIESQVSYIRSE